MSYHAGRFTLSGIAQAEERIAYAMSITPEGPTFLELIKTDGCYVVRSHDLAGALKGAWPPPPRVLGAAYARGHVAELWLRLTADATTAWEMERGRL